MAIEAAYLGVGEGFMVNGSVLFDIYGKMFEPSVPDRPSPRYSMSVHNESYSYNLSGFQQGNEVCVSALELHNGSGSYVSGNVEVVLQQWRGGDWFTPPTNKSTRYNQQFEDGDSRGYYYRVGVDPDEFRPGITQYRFKRTFNGNESFYKTLNVSNLSFDTTPHPAGYLRVEGINLCYVPPCYYSGSSNTGYKHTIKPDGYSGGNVGTDKAGYIRIPSSSSDHHIYYVNEYGIVNRTSETYGRPSYDSQSGNSGYIWMTPSTSSIPEQAGYNYICYCDGGGYKRRLGVGDV